MYFDMFYEMFWFNQNSYLGIMIIPFTAEPGSSRSTWITFGRKWLVVISKSHESCAPGALHWRQNERVGVPNHQPHHCLLNCLFRRRSKKTSKLRVTGLCVGSAPLTGEFPAQRASNAGNVSIWWRHHGFVAKQRARCQMFTNIKRIIF